MVAASKPTSSLSVDPHFLVDVLNVDFGALIGDQGSSPLDRWSFAPTF